MHRKSFIHEIRYFTTVLREVLSFLLYCIPLRGVKQLILAAALLEFMNDKK